MRGGAEWSSEADAATTESSNDQRTRQKIATMTVYLEHGGRLYTLDEVRHIPRLERRVILREACEDAVGRIVFRAG